MSRGENLVLVAALALAAVGWPGSAVAGSHPTFEQAQSSFNLVARVSRWQGDPVKKRKGPPGFDLQFRLVGSRFDGNFGVEGLPQTVPEGEAFDGQVKLTNVGKKDIKVSSVTVVGDGLSLTTQILQKKVPPKSSVQVASFKVPPQSFSGSSYLITVVLSNGDRHRATLSFAKPS